MKRPPPITEFYRFPITAGFALLAVFVTVVSKTGRSIERLVMSVRAFEGEPYRLVTSALPHADAMHLVFNVIWLWVFGTALEERFGPLRLLLLILFFAAGSAAAEYAIFVGGIGLSGVVYGLFGLLWVLSRTDARLRGAIDERNSILFVVWFFLCIATTVLDVWRVANVAHGVGWLLGLLTGLAISGGLRPSRPRNSIRAASILGLVVVFVASVVGAAKFRPRVNFAANGGADSARLASEEFEQGHYDEAIARYRVALTMSPKVASTWYNLGVTYSRKGDFEAALKAFSRAKELSPEAEDIKRAVLDVTRYLGYKAQEKGDYSEAVRLYEEVFAMGGEDAHTLYNVALAYRSLARMDDAKRALARAAKLDPTYAAYIEGFAADFADAGVDGAAP